MPGKMRSLDAQLHSFLNAALDRSDLLHWPRPLYTQKVLSEDLGQESSWASQPIWMFMFSQRHICNVRIMNVDENVKLLETNTTECREIVRWFEDIFSGGRKWEREY